MQFKILTLNQIAEEGLRYLPKNQYELVSEWNKDPDGVIVRSAVMHGLELPRSVQAVVRAGAGVNNIPVEEYTAAGVAVFNTPGANANAVKELVLTGMLLAARPVVEALEFVRTLKGSHEEMGKVVEKEKKRFAGTEIAGKTIGVVGLGAIGSKVCDMCISLGMDVIGYDPVLSVDAAIRLNPRVQRVEALQSLVSRCDYISLHLPVLPETKKMFDGKLFACVKKGAVLLNYARGELVDNTALLAALESGRLTRYMTDFPDEGLTSHPRIFASPHLGASTKESEDNCAIIGVRQMMDFLENGNIVNSVNFPALTLDRSGAARMTVTARDGALVSGKLCDVLGAANVKIKEMATKNGPKISYSIIETEQALPATVLETIKNIDGILKVRILDSHSGN
jgi:D-3-phosphoglycerate dehydrogenase